MQSPRQTRFAGEVALGVAALQRELALALESARRGSRDDLEDFLRERVRGLSAPLEDPGEFLKQRRQEERARLLGSGNVSAREAQAIAREHKRKKKAVTAELLQEVTKVGCSP